MLRTALKMSQEKIPQSVEFENMSLTVEKIISTGYTF